MHNIVNYAKLSMVHQNIPHHRVAAFRPNMKIRKAKLVLSQRLDMTTSTTHQKKKKSLSDVSQCCRIKVSIVSNERRSVMLNNIVMIVRHHLGKKT